MMRSKPQYYNVLEEPSKHHYSQAYTTALTKKETTIILHKMVLEIFEWLDNSGSGKGLSVTFNFQ